MFGLDARIALAIFGALSVISGASLHSAIKTARATAFITEMKEVDKAWEQYYLDTHEQLQQKSTDPTKVGKFYTLRTIDLAVDNGIRGWNGPYLNYESNSFTAALMKDSENLINLAILTNESWNSYSNGLCTSGKQCYKWISVHQETDHLAKDIDALIDNNDGDSSGNFRWSFSGGLLNKYIYYFKGDTIQNPND
ncbi:MAG TPA: hypothetical protein DCL21_02980 [Alphaproteobacteria bacterium]|nr:hypothetical protein [Alphaproteobacteria bacterium]